MNDLNETITEDSQASLIRIILFQRKSSKLIKRPNYGHMFFFIYRDTCTSTLLYSIKTIYLAVTFSYSKPLVDSLKVYDKSMTGVCMSEHFAFYDLHLHMYIVIAL